MIERLHSLLWALVILLQVPVGWSEERVEAASHAILKAEVHELRRHEKEQAAEIEQLRARLAHLEVRPNGDLNWRHSPDVSSARNERTLQEGRRVEAERTEAEEEEEDEEAEEKEEEEEEEEETTDPVDLTLAISLLGYITVVMTLFKLCNHEDEDMRIYVWSVLSSTLSIFLAVLLFTTLNGICHHYLSPSGASLLVDIVIDFLELILCFALMQMSVAFISGSFEKSPFENPETPGMSIAEQKAQRERRFKSVATLFAHMSGFAAINFGGGIQHLEALQRTPILTFIVPPLLFAGQIILCRAVRKVRTRTIAKILESSGRPDTETYEQLSQIPAGGHELQQEEKVGRGKAKKTKEAKSGIEWCVEKWDEETYESENEVSSLAISFLLLQAIRYNLTGIMPNNIGIEEEHWLHPQGDIYGLTVCGVLLAVLCVAIVVVSVDAFPESRKIEPGSFDSFLKRVALVMQGTSAMGFAWALMYTSKWQITLLYPSLNPNAVTARVLLAGIITIISFFIILFLDFVADQEATGEKTDKAIIAIISSLSILVGFTWEQSFDGAVEVLAESCFKEHPIMAEMTITCGIFYFVYPQWRRYILKKLLALKEEKAKKEGEEE